MLTASLLVVSPRALNGLVKLKVVIWRWGMENAKDYKNHFRTKNCKHFWIGMMVKRRNSWVHNCILTCQSLQDVPKLWGGYWRLGWLLHELNERIMRRKIPLRKFCSAYVNENIFESIPFYRWINGYTLRIASKISCVYPVKKLNGGQCQVLCEEAKALHSLDHCGFIWLWLLKSNEAVDAPGYQQQLVD